MKRCLILAVLALAGCAPAAPQPWLGYGEGDYALIGAPQPGWVTRLAVERGAQVHPGELLFTLDATQQAAGRDAARAALGQAQAALGQEQATLALARRELVRQNGLAQDNAGIEATREQAATAVAQSQARIDGLAAQIAAMRADLAGSAYSLAQRRVLAGTGGAVEDIYYRPGEYVAASVPVVSVLPPGNVYARFFVPETQLAGVHLGDHVRITCDGCRPLPATITFIAADAEYSPPVIFSVGNREKLVYKLEARAPGGLPLHPGEPIEVRPIR